MVIYKILDEHNTVIELVKSTVERDSILEIDSRYSYDTIVMHKFLNRKTKEEDWIYS